MFPALTDQRRRGGISQRHRDVFDSRALMFASHRVSQHHEDVMKDNSPVLFSSSIWPSGEVSHFRDSCLNAPIGRVIKCPGEKAKGVLESHLFIAELAARIL